MSLQEYADFKNVIVDGMLTFGCINLLCGIMFLVIFAIMFLKWSHDRKEMEQ